MAKRMKYESKWYVSELAAHKQAMGKPMRSSVGKNSDADSKAAEYAEWLCARDGVELGEAYVSSVKWDSCGAGYRPRLVVFSRSPLGPAVYSGRETVHTVELPHWDWDGQEKVEAFHGNAPAAEAEPLPQFNFLTHSESGLQLAA